MVSISFIGAPGGLTDKVLIVFLPDTQATAEKSAGITQPNDLQLPGAEIVAEVKKSPRLGYLRESYLVKSGHSKAPLHARKSRKPQASQGS